MDRLVVHPEPVSVALEEPPLDPRLVEYVLEAALMSGICEAFTCLPRAGGALDQPAGLMRRMLILRNYKAAVALVEDPNPRESQIPEPVSKLAAAGMETRINRAVLYTEAQLRERGEVAPWMTAAPSP